MNRQTVTITLPDDVYQRVEKHSRKTQRSVEEEIAAVVKAAMPVEDKLSDDLEQELSQLEFFTDDELWNAAQTTIPTSQSERMQSLLDKQQREGLTAEERAEAESLSNYFDHMMLVRSKALALLKKRGHDVSPLLK